MNVLAMAGKDEDDCSEQCNLRFTAVFRENKEGAIQQVNHGHHDPYMRALPSTRSGNGARSTTQKYPVSRAFRPTTLKLS